MIEIPLTQGQVALIDDEDFSKVSSYKWHAVQPNSRYKKTFYAQAYAKEPGKESIVYMHRLIMKAKIIDHKNGVGTDNRKENLREVTASQNQQNAQPRIGSSRLKGVSWSKGCRKWLAQIRKNGEYFYIGVFKSETDAAKAYDAKAKELFGEFARTNY